MSQKKSRHGLKCPKCKYNVSGYRIKRKLLDRLISKVIPVRRYHCYYCGWQGLLVKRIE